MPGRGLAGKQWGGFRAVLFGAAVFFGSPFASVEAVEPFEPDPFPSPRELRALSIEEIADLEITAVARRPEAARVAPSAVSIVRREQIRRSGAKTLPEALRLATGVHVARSDSNTWAIGVRGGNLTTTNKLLVMQDGRHLYSPLFSGVFWDVQDVVLEDVERIEVVRGPGATMWGANAVNGVINIVTRNARHTQGGWLSGGAGTHERGFASARYGGQAGENTWYRVYARGWDRDDVVAADGGNLDDRRRFGQSGFRLDSEPAADVAWTLQGDLYQGRFYRDAQDAIDVSGTNLLGRWTHSYEADSHVTVQAYYDRVERDIPGTIGKTRDTGDVDFQHRFPVGERHDVMWGGNFRVSRDDIDNTDRIAFVPDNRTIRVAGGFIQDRISLLPDELELTVGSKFEHNSYSGFEYQPSSRLAWMPTGRQTVWGAVSRAVRTPARIDTDVRIFDPRPNEPDTRGNPDFRSERLYAYEAGYRIQPADPVTFDFAVFYHDFERLRSVEPVDPDLQVIDNQLKGEFFGGEVSVNYQVNDWWRIRGGYAHLQRRIRAEPESGDDPGGRGAEGNDPRHIAFLRSGMDLGDRRTLDGTVRHVSALPNPRVPSYTELDLRIAFYPRDDLDIAVVGRNLLESSHREFGATHAVPRSVFFRVKWEL